MNLLRLLVVSVLLLLFTGCAERRQIEVREFHFEGLKDFMEKLQIYSSIEAVLNLQYEDKRILQGDAFLKISDKELLLRVYYMGFPAGEIYQENGEIVSNLNIDRDRLRQLATGIRMGFLWWRGDFNLEENSNNYFLIDKNSERTIVLDKTTFMPLSQSITIEGQNILIEYSRYGEIQAEDGTVLKMPMHLSVFHKDKWLKINFEKIKFKDVKKTT